MAGGAAILSTYDEVLKTFYLPAIQEQLNHETFLADRIEVNEEDVSGKNATIEMHYGRSTGTGARADNGSLPTAGYQKYKTATVPMKYQYGRVSFSGPTIAATRDEKGSYARVIDAEITGIVKDLSKEVNRQLWGAGYGMLGHCVGADTTAIELAKSYMGNTWGDGFGSTFGGKYFKENSSGNVAIAASFSNTAAADLTVDDTDINVTAVTVGTTTDTLTNTSPGQSTAEGDFLVRAGNLATFAAASGGASGRLEMMGLRGIVDNQNIEYINMYDSTNRVNMDVPDPLQGLDVASYTWWVANVDTHSSGRYLGQRALTLKLMQEMFDNVEEEAGVGYGPDAIMTTRAIRREYLEQVSTDRRYVQSSEPIVFDGGFRGLEYNGIPLMTDNDAIDGEMYFLTMKDLQLYRMSDYEWMDRDGAVLSRITGYDAYEAVLYRYAELGCKRRNSQGVLCDLAYDA